MTQEELVEQIDHLDESLELTLYHLETIKRERNELLEQLIKLHNH